VFLSVLFWFSLAGLAYIYAGYPLLVWGLSRRHGNSVARGDWNGTVSIVLVAHNEAQRLPAKIAGLLASTASQRIVEILIGSDGSTDASVAIASSYPDFRVRVVPFAERRGKPSVINDLVPQCRGDVVVFVDARQDVERTAIARMLENFADSRVGVVSGELILESASTATAAAEGVGAYWRYEKWIRTSESRFRSVPGATGALYAMRRNLFRPIPSQTLLDDVVIPMQAIEQGYRCVLENGAEAFDRPSNSTSQEAVRKRRTIAGCAQLVVGQPRWLLPWNNPIWWEFCSHKLARLASPVLLVVAMATNVTLIEIPAYRVLLATQLTLYAAAAVGWLYQQLGLKSKVFGPLLMFLSLNATTLFALWDACRGRFRATWQKTT
jgi:biofilm PGA synthesis N-glycosyltransferase PgaC